MHVLFVSSEVYPLAKTGGLADVSEALPAALAGLGVDMNIILPGYVSALDRAHDKSRADILNDVVGFDGVELIRGFMPRTGLPVWMVRCPELYERRGGIYQGPEGSDWPDNSRRFAVLNHVAARLACGRTRAPWWADILHANDWHAGLAPALLRSAGEHRPASIITIHNLAFQGLFPLDHAASVGLPSDLLNAANFEFHGQMSFLKGGIALSDRVTTVSPTYADEILTPEFGNGLDGLLRHRKSDLTGILNGVDYGVWDPSHDTLLPHLYSVADIAGKRHCKAALQEMFGLEVNPDTPLIAFMSRLTGQKMADCVLEALPWIEAQGAQFVLLAEGDRGIEEAFRRAAQGSRQIAVKIGYSEEAAHPVLGGADILLAPSRFEPCGLTHLYALRYGVMPIVRRTGGLADTVTHATNATIEDGSANGFLFEHATTADMMGAIAKALYAFGYPLTWRRMQLQAMSADYSWRVSARRYLSLYEELTGATIKDADRDGLSDGDPFDVRRRAI